MVNDSTAGTQTAAPGTAGRRRLAAGLPMYLALFAVAVVWMLGCLWSYQEQSAFAADKGFAFPHLLPLVIDGFAVAMAGVAWAASLDARPAVPARLATLVAVAGSAASNGVWAALRTNHDTSTVVLAVAVPVAANLAFEVLLAELRRQVQRRRGLPAPVALPGLRMIRVVLAPASTFHAWRVLVLELTAPAATPPALPPGAGVVDAHVSTGAQGAAGTGPGGLDAYVSTTGGRVALDGGPGRDDRALSRPAVPWDAVGWDGHGVPPDPAAGTQELLPFPAAGSPARLALPEVGRGHEARRAMAQTDRARAVAVLHEARTGALPTVRELAELADVGRGTADRALTALRAPTNGHPTTGGGPDSAGTSETGALHQ